MKRENFLLVSITGCSTIGKKGSYKVGIKLGDKVKYSKWSKKSDTPGWYSGTYFNVTYEAAGSRKKGLEFKLYKKGFLGFKSVVATHQFDPGRITFYGCYNDWIDMTSTGSKPTLVCRLKVRVQYVRSTDYFTCPSCPRLDNHVPILFLGNINNVTLKDNKTCNKKMRVVLSCGKFKESAETENKGIFGSHFMADPSLLTKKTIKITVYKKKSVWGTCSVKVDDVMEGNWCDLKLPIKKSDEEKGTLNLLLQTVYECCDCIVEREDEDGDVDIPMKPVEKAPAPTPSFSLQGTIPGMSLPVTQPKPVPQPTPVQPVRIAQTVTIAQNVPVAQPIQPSMFPTVSYPVADPYGRPNPVNVPNSSANNVYMSIPGMGGY